MKKFLAILLSLFYFLSANMCFAGESLYVLQGVSIATAQSIVEQSYSAKKFRLSCKNPYLGRLEANPEKYTITVLQNNGASLLCYFNSNSTDRVEKEVLNQLKKSGYSYFVSDNNTYRMILSVKAENVLNNVSNSYDFEQPQVKQNSQKASDSVDNTVLKGYVGQIAKGTSFKAYLQTPINTATVQYSDAVNAVLTEDWTYQGNVIAPQGSLVSGIVSKARPATYGSRNGRVVVVFDRITTPEGKNYKISAEPFDVTVTNDGKFSSTVQNAAVGVALGALAGLLIGICSSGSSAGKAALWGAGIGTGVALAGSAVEQGVDAEIPVYTEIDITLNKPLSVILNY